jgi:hypothetical protein
MADRDGERGSDATLRLAEHLFEMRVSKRLRYHHHP